MTKSIVEQAQKIIADAAAPATGEELAEKIHKYLDETLNDRSLPEDTKLRNEIHMQLEDRDEKAAQAFHGGASDADEDAMHRRERARSR